MLESTPDCADKRNGNNLTILRQSKVFGIKQFKDTKKGADQKNKIRMIKLEKSCKGKLFYLQESIKKKTQKC